jgi:DNA polymerase II large subunit
MIKGDIELISDKLKRGESGFVGNRFSHNTKDFNLGNNHGVYKSLPTMKEKVSAQMELACKLRGVDEDDVARLVLERHFIRDIRGNLRKFARQGFRCSGCNEKFRRPPLVGICIKCGGKLIFTISEGGVRKYLEPAMELIDNYNISSYTMESVELIGDYIERIFGKEEKQATL